MLDSRAVCSTTGWTAADKPAPAAGRAVGAATARALAAHGYRLALLARRVDRLQQLATELGNGTVAIAADVTYRDALVAAADHVQQELGRADVLVNNAGLMLLGSFDPSNVRRPGGWWRSTSSAR